VEWEQVFDPFMKWSYKMDQVERVPEFTRRAIKVARTAPGGPVFLQMTQDLNDVESEATILPQDRFQVAAGVKAKPELIEQAARMLIEAENPLLVVGLEVTKSKGCENWWARRSCRASAPSPTFRHGMNFPWAGSHVSPPICARPT
jgi:thiamine pyrophosphate-dependent acetolactate synthase large subunit-like protein